MLLLLINYINDVCNPFNTIKLVLGIRLDVYTLAWIAYISRPMIGFHNVNIHKHFRIELVKVAINTLSYL